MHIIGVEVERLLQYISAEKPASCVLRSPDLTDELGRFRICRAAPVRRKSGARAPVPVEGAMSYAALMTYVNADRGSEHVVRVAAGLADKFCAKLIGVSALAIMPLFAQEGVLVVDAATAADTLEEMKAKLAEAGTRFCASAGAERQTEWRTELEFPTEALIRAARSADLIIIGHRKGLSDRYRFLDNGRAILGMGRPTLVVPEAIKTLRADHVVIGWKDTRETRRAVQDALPFLHEATQVTIVEFCEEDEKTSARDNVEDVVRYLISHRIRSDACVVPYSKNTGVGQLVGFAQGEGADLIVTGAYGHTRLGEWIFGGVTRHLLTSSPICCLMSH